MSAKPGFRNTVVLLVTSAAVGPLLLLAALELYQIRSRELRSVRSDLERAAGMAAADLERRLQLAAAAAGDLGGDSDIGRAVQSLLYVERADDLLRESRRRHPVVAAVLLLDGEGRTVTAIPEALADVPAPGAAAGWVRDIVGGHASARTIGLRLETVRDPGALAALASRLRPSDPAVAGELETAPVLTVLAPVQGLLDRVGGGLVLVIPAARLRAAVQSAADAGTVAGVDFTEWSAQPGAAGPLGAGSTQAGQDSQVGVVQLAGGELQATARRRLVDGRRDAPDTHGVAVTVSLKDDATRRFAVVRRTTIVAAMVLGLTLIAVGLLGFRLARRLTEPLERLTGLVMAYAARDYQAQRPAMPFAELETVAVTLEAMGQAVAAHVEERAAHERERGELERAQIQAELAALRAQMNPHFLFNALNGIGALVGTDQGRAVEALHRLAAIYRAIVDAGGQRTWSLAHEVTVVRDYLGLEALRFGERLVYALPAPDALPPVEVPGLILQTLAENAVKHGIARSRAGGEIRVTVTPAAGGLRLAVANTGAPYKAAAGGGPGGSEGHTGLVNTRRRLELVYGHDCGFSVGTEGGMTVASFIIPCTAGVPAREDFT